jgi:uncharacterized protein involved in exopolysaccharide biosynthesis
MSFMTPRKPDVDLIVALAVIGTVLLALGVALLVNR